MLQSSLRSLDYKTMYWARYEILHDKCQILIQRPLWTPWSWIHLHKMKWCSAMCIHIMHSANQNEFMIHIFWQLPGRWAQRRCGRAMRQCIRQSCVASGTTEGRWKCQRSAVTHTCLVLCSIQQESYLALQRLSQFMNVLAIDFLSQSVIVM